MNGIQVTLSSAACGWNRTLTVKFQPAGRSQNVANARSHAYFLGVGVGSHAHESTTQSGAAAPSIYCVLVSGIGIGPPGESAFLAVRISTPVSVTSKVCSVQLALPELPGARDIPN